MTGAVLGSLHPPTLLATKADEETEDYASAWGYAILSREVVGGTKKHHLRKYPHDNVLHDCTVQSNH